LKVLLRKDWIAAIVFVAIFTGLSSRGSYLAVQIPTRVLVYGIAVLIVYRFGLVPLASRSSPLICSSTFRLARTFRLGI